MNPIQMIINQNQQDVQLYGVSYETSEIYQNKMSEQNDLICNLQVESDDL